MPEAAIRARTAFAVAVLTLMPTAPLCANDAGAQPVAIERPGYGAIELKSPSRRSIDSASTAAMPPAAASRQQAAGMPLTTQRAAAMPLVTIASSLAVVLGLFAALVWVMKKAGPASRRSTALPDEALRLLGQKSLGPSGSIALIRCGQTVLVVGISAAGMQRLAEISDPEQVRNLEAICLGESSDGFEAALGAGPPPGTFAAALGGGERRPLHDAAAGPHDRKRLFTER